MELTDMIEDAVLKAFNRDALISQFAAVSNDSTSADDQPYLVFVKAQDRGDFTGLPGVGIKQVDVEITIQFNLGSEDQRGGRTALLSQLSERIDDLLAASGYLPAAKDIIDNLSRPGLKIFAIHADKEKRRTDIDMTRERVVEREFICAQTA